MRVGDFQVVKGPDTGTLIAVEAMVTLGRDVEGPGRLSDRTVSTRHARVMRRGDGQLLIEDLGSRNGTLVNGGRIQGSQLLAVGDVVQLGNTLMRLEPERASPLPGPAAGPAAGGYAGPAPPAVRVDPLAGSPSGQPLGGPSSAPPSGGPPPGSFPSQSAPPGSFPGQSGSFPGQSGSFAGPPSGPPGGFSGPPQRGAPRRVGRTAAATGVVVALFAGAFAVGWGVGHHERSDQSATTVPGGAGGGTVAGSQASGTVYVESNDAAPGTNAVLAYTYGPQASLQPLRITSYPTGGSGSANLTDNGTLDATGHITVDASRHLLLAVNQGSDTVAVFHIATNGSLQAVAGSPFPSGGKAPAAIGVNGNLVVVVNKAQDGLRDLSKVAPNYTTFQLTTDGALIPTGHSVSVAPGSSPTQALITPDGHLVFGTEESGQFSVFLLGADGSLTPGRGSGLKPPGDLFPSSIPEANRFPIGLSIDPSSQTLYAPLANANTLAVYNYQSDGQLSFVGSVKNNGGKEPCWSNLSADGSRLYVDDAASNTTSVYNTSDPRKPVILENFELKDNGNPWDFSFDPTGHWLFVVAPRARQVNVSPGQGNQLHVETIGANGLLSEDQQPVSIPVPLNTNPFGMAVVADS